MTKEKLRKLRKAIKDNSDAIRYLDEEVDCGGEECYKVSCGNVTCFLNRITTAIEELND